MSVLEKIKELEGRSFRLLNDLFLGAEKLDEELNFCCDRRIADKIGDWGVELLEDEENVERFIDGLDDQVAFFLKKQLVCLELKFL